MMKKALFRLLIIALSIIILLALWLVTGVDDYNLILFLICISVSGLIVYLIYKITKFKSIIYVKLEPSCEWDEIKKPDVKYSINGYEIYQGWEKVPVHVVGVTQMNDGYTRQSILRKIYLKEPPYDGVVNTYIQEEEYAGEPTFEVWANDEQIGYVPRELVPFFDQNRHRYDHSNAVSIYGGGKTVDGKRINYGASFMALFRLS